MMVVVPSWSKIDPQHSSLKSWMYWVISISIILGLVLCCMFYRINLLVSFFLLTVTAITAQDVPASNSNSVCPNAYQPGASFCPKISELYRGNKEIWQSKSGWKANEPSFVPEITRFIGVQWKGVNIGRATCIYTGSSDAEFPVSLYLNIIVKNPKDITDNAQYQPQGSEKTKLYKPLNDDQGTLNCFSSNNNICDCPFFRYEVKEESSREIIFSIQKINGQSLPFMY